MFGRKSEDKEAENQSSINRRRFVKTLGAASTTSVLGFGTANAETLSTTEREAHLQQIKQQFGSVPTIQSAIDNLGSNFLEQLEVEGFLNNSLRDELENMEIKTREQMWESGEGITVELWPDATTPKADINIHKQVGDDLISIHILPSEDRSYALLNPTVNGDGDDCSMTPIVQTKDGLTPEACQCTYQCHAYPPCNGNATRFPAYCVTKCSDGTCRLEHTGCCGTLFDCNATKVCNCGCATGNC